MRNKVRVTRWMIWAICFLLMIGGRWIYLGFIKDKKPIYVCAPHDMEYAFKRLLKKSDLKPYEYEIKIVDDVNKASIIVDYGKDSEAGFEEIAYSTFIIGYSYEKADNKELKSANLLENSGADDDLYYLKFYKFIEEAKNEGSWKNLGADFGGSFKIYYPDQDSIYWQDFYNFMLVNVNKGVYPTESQELKQAKDTIQKFINSPYTEGVKKFDDKIVMKGGFDKNSIWVLPEKAILNTSGGAKKVYYPTYTVYFKYYIKSMDSIGDELLKKENNSYNINSAFYNSLNESHYRTKSRFEISIYYRDIDSNLGIGNQFNLIEIE